MMFLYGIGVGFVIACLTVEWDIRHGNIDLKEKQNGN